MSCGCVQQVINAAGAAFRVAKRVAAGNEVAVSAEVKATRLAICADCPERQTSDDGTAHKCTACGCWLDGKILCKACLETEDCPLNKWSLKL